ncbi:MAG: cation:dicarboxylase symporter family transporter, partial [Limisphaerales bacterium]
MNSADPITAAATRTPWYRVLYIQVLLAVALGIAVGAAFPFDKTAPDQWSAAKLKPLGDAFIALVKMMIAPIIFCTVVHGIASMSDMKKLGRVGIKTLLYFEVVSTLALIIGLVVVNWLQPGAGFNIDPATLDPDIAKGYAKKAESQTMTAFLLNIIPATLFSAFVTGDLLQVLLVSALTAFAITSLNNHHRLAVLNVIERGSEIFFGVMRIVVQLAPVGAFGAMAFTVGSYGLGSLEKLLKLMAGFYAT